jgi:hypothetical protein
MKNNYFYVENYAELSGRKATLSSVLIAMIENRYKIKINMKKAVFLVIISLTFLTACSKKLTNIQNKSPEEIAAAYKVLKDVLHGLDAEQKKDIYLSKDAVSFGKRNYLLFSCTVADIILATKV